MKVNLPVDTKDSIDLFACDLKSGILLSKNPYGIILYDDSNVSYNFHTTSDIEGCEFYEDTLPELWERIKEDYPDISFEYYKNA